MESVQRGAVIRGECRSPRRAVRTARERRADLAAGCRLPAVGSSPDGVWAEKSVAVVGIDLVAARSLGREFGQNAVFEVADGMLRVYACFDGWIDERPL